MILLVLCALLLGAFDLAAQSKASTESLHWVPAPSLLPPGAMIAVVAGNPAGTGPATIVLSMPDGYRMPPHYHPSYERVEVKQGTLLWAIPSSLRPACITMSFLAPYTITYVNSYQAPRQTGAFPYGY